MTHWAINNSSLAFLQVCIFCCLPPKNLSFHWVWGWKNKKKGKRGRGKGKRKWKGKGKRGRGKGKGAKGKSWGKTTQNNKIKKRSIILKSKNFLCKGACAAPFATPRPLSHQTSLETCKLYLFLSCGFGEKYDSERGGGVKYEFHD